MLADQAAFATSDMRFELIRRAHPPLPLTFFTEQRIQIIAFHPRISGDIVEDRPVVPIQPIYADQTRNFMLQMIMVEAVKEPRDVQGEYAAILAL